MAQAMARRDVALIFGGGRNGLMGAVADTVLAHGGTAIGVMPRSLMDREIAHHGLSELHLVESMHERKLLMAELSDGFVGLPGGAGTLDEFVEQWTWAQLGIHRKPCALLNVRGFFDPLLAMVDRMVDEGFLRPAYAEMLVVEEKPDALLDRLETYRPPEQKWRFLDAVSEAALAGSGR